MIKMKQLMTLVIFSILTVPGFAQVLDKPVAVVRLHETANIGQRVMRQQTQLVEEQLGRSVSQSERRELLQAQISEELINQAAAEANIQVTDSEMQQAITNQRAGLDQPLSEEQFRRLIEQRAGLTWDEYRDQIRQRLLQEKYILQEKQDVLQSVETPSQAEIQRFYDENATEFSNPAMVRFEHVFIDTRQSSNAETRRKRDTIEELYSEIQSGSTSFDELLDASVDDASYSAGDFGYLMRQDAANRQLLGQGFIDTVFSLDQGEMSDGIIESNVGFHIVRVTNKRRARILDLNDPVLPGRNVTVRDQIRNYLVGNEQQRAFQRALEEVVQELRDRADIQVYEENLDW